MCPHSFTIALTAVTIGDTASPSTSHAVSPDALTAVTIALTADHGRQSQLHHRPHSFTIVPHSFDHRPHSIHHRPQLLHVVVLGELHHRPDSFTIALTASADRPHSCHHRRYSFTMALTCCQLIALTAVTIGDTAW